MWATVNVFCSFSCPSRSGRTPTTELVTRRCIWVSISIVMHSLPEARGVLPRSRGPDTSRVSVASRDFNVNFDVHHLLRPPTTAPARAAHPAHQRARPTTHPFHVIRCDLAATLSMSSTPMIIENSGKLEVARALQARLDAAKLHIVEDQSRFDTLQSALAKDPGLVSDGVAGTTDPAIVAAEVASQIVCVPLPPFSRSRTMKHA